MAGVANDAAPIGSAAPAAAMPAVLRKPRRCAATPDSCMDSRLLMFCALMFDTSQIEMDEGMGVGGAVAITPSCVRSPPAAAQGAATPVGVKGQWQQRRENPAR